MVQREKLREDFSQRLAQASKNAGLDEHGRGMAIARALGVTSKAVSKWFNSESVPRQDKMDALARFLRVDVIWLQHGRDDIESSIPPADIGTVKIPLLNYEQANEWAECQEIRRFDGELTYLLCDIKVSPDSFAVEIDGDSMTPQFRSGDRIIVDPGVRPLPGDFVMARSNFLGKTVFKKYRITGMGIHGHETFNLVPLNPDYPTLRSESDDLKIIGTMVEHRIPRRRG